MENPCYRKLLWILSHLVMSINIFRKDKIGVGRDYNITLNFRCKLLIRSSYSHSALFAYPFGHHSRNKYLIPLAEGLFESPTGILRRELQSQPTKIAVPPNQKQLSIYVGSIVNDEQSS